MTPEQFIYWLQGYVEIAGEDHAYLSGPQFKVMKDHLNLVLTKVTPDRTLTKDQEKMMKGAEIYNPTITRSEPKTDYPWDRDFYQKGPNQTMC